MGKHQKVDRNKKLAACVTTGLALEVVTLLGLGYATNSPVPGVGLLATSIFIDGTRDIFPTSDPQGPDRMAGAFQGQFDQTGKGGTNVFVEYPRSFGMMTGLTDPSYDDSKAKATAGIIQAVKDARDPAKGGNSNETIYVVGFSQGANAAADAVEQLEAEGYDTEGITFVLIGNGTRNDGGLWSRLPQGVYLPLVGLSFGGSTTSEYTNVIQVSKQYDGASDVPKYIMNPLAIANTALGFLYVHNGYYSDVEFDPEDPNGPNDDYIVTYSADGKITDVLIPNKPGDLPLTRPLLDMGVPKEVVVALDPLLRAIIETAYDRPEPGSNSYPDEAVHAQLMPGPSQWVTDFKAIAVGLKQTMEALDELNDSHSQTTQLKTTAADTQEIAPPSADPEEQQARRLVAPQPPKPPVVPQRPKLLSPPVWSWQPAAPVASLPPAAPPPPPSEVIPPPAEPQDVEDGQDVEGGDDEELILLPTGKPTLGTGPNKVVPGMRLTPNGWKPGAIIRGVVGALTGTSTGTTAPAAPSSAPDPGPPPAADPPSSPEEPAA